MMGNAADSPRSNEPLVSVAIPAYNAERTIKECLDSILEQTWKKLEVVVCDDASTDNTCSVVQSIGDPRVRLLRNKVNQGEGRTRDTAISACRARWIALCDADDAWLANRVAILVGAAADNDQAVVFDDMMMCHDTTAGLVPWKRVRGNGAFDANGLPVRIGVDRWIGSRRMLIKPLFSRYLLTRANALHSDHACGADLHFVLMLVAGGGELVYVPGAFYLYRFRLGSASSDKARYTWLREVLAGFLDQFEPQPLVYNALLKRIERMRRLELYRSFLDVTRRLRFDKSLLMLMRRPWFMWRFLSHNAQMLMGRVQGSRISAKGTTVDE